MKNKIRQKENWWISEEIYNCNPVMTTWMVYDYNIKNLKKYLGLKTKFRCMAIFEKGLTKIIFEKNELNILSEESLQKLVTSPEWGVWLNVDVKKRIDQWFDVSRRMQKTNLANLSDKELLILYLDFYKIHQNVYTPAFAINAADFVDSKFSKFLLNLLKEKKNRFKIKFLVGEVFSILTTPDFKSYAQKEYEDLIKILGQIEKNVKLKELFAKNDSRIIEVDLENKFPSYYGLISRHVLRYGWLSYQFEGPGWKMDYFIDILASLVRQNKKFKDLQREQEERKRFYLASKKEYLNIFRLNKSEKMLFKVASGFVAMKGYRKDATFYAMYCQDFLFKEIAKRKYLSLRQVRYIYPWEFKNLLLKNKVDTNELNERYKYHVFYSDQEGEKILSDKKGREFVKKFNFIKEKTKGIKELYGDTASPGKIRGVVKIVNTPEDMKDFQKGSILVSVATSPDLMPAIKKCGAIVTDMGGVICHASIISRELNIPCVVGTNIATKVLKNGDLLEVDATHGRVTLIDK